MYLCCNFFFFGRHKANLNIVQYTMLSMNLFEYLHKLCDANKSVPIEANSIIFC